LLRLGMGDPSSHVVHKADQGRADSTLDSLLASRHHQQLGPSFWNGTLSVTTQAEAVDVKH
jgi:hypothetical protein